MFILFLQNDLFMNKILISTFCFAILLGCGGAERSETDVTDSDDQNVSREQRISEDEQTRKDSTSLDLVGEDTTQTAN